MQGKTVEFQDYTVLIEYEKKGNLERCYLPRTLVDTSTKGTLIRFSEKETLPYFSVDLSGLEAPNLTGIQIEQKFRRLGLWTPEDYRKRYTSVNKLARELRIDPTQVLNAAAQIPKGDD